MRCSFQSVSPLGTFDSACLMLEGMRKGYMLTPSIAIERRLIVLEQLRRQ